MKVSIRSGLQAEMVKTYQQLESSGEEVVLMQHRVEEGDSRGNASGLLEWVRGVLPILVIAIDGQVEVEADSTRGELTPRYVR